MSERYRHTQIGWVTSIVLLVVGLLVAPSLVLAGAGFVSVAVGVVILGVLVCFSTMTVSVNDEELEIRLGVGLIRKRVRLRDVRSYRSVRNPWWWGWGIRFFPGGTLYNVSGFSAVELMLPEGKRLRVGTDQPSELVRALERVVGEPKPVSPEEQAQAERRVKRGWLILVALAVFVPLALGTLFYFEMRPPRVSVSAESFSVQSFLYGAEIARRDVTSVSLEQRLPRILLRTNGFALGRTLRGHFKLDDLGEGQLFIELGEPPYLVLRTSDDYTVVAFEDGELTRWLHEELRSAWSLDEQ